MASSKSVLETDIRINKNQLKVLEGLIISLKATETAAQADQKAQYTTQITALTNQITEIENLIKTQESKIKSINQLEQSSNSLPLPTFGTVDTYRPEEILILCQNFSGEDRNDFQTFYQKLLNFVENRKLTEKATKDLLSGLLKGEAFECFHSLRTESFENIITNLNNRFGFSKSIYYYLNSLRNLTRNPNETLQSALARATYFIDKTRSLVPIEEQAARKNHLLLELLFKLTTATANKRIREEQIRLHRSGLIADYKSLLDIALFVEQDSQNLDPSHIFVATPVVATPHTNDFIATPAIATSNTRESRKPSPYRRPERYNHSRARSSSPTLNYKPEIPDSPPVPIPSRASSPPPPSSLPHIDYHERSSRNFHDDYERPPLYYDQTTSYNRPPNSDYHHNSNYRRFSGRNDFRYSRYNHIGANQLKNLIEKLTEIMNILNGPPNNRQ